jgi:hypothetical protein
MKKITEGIGLGSNVSAVKGTVSIEYSDPITGKIRERIRKKNHIFADAFRCANWSNVLTNTLRPQLFLTDDNTPPSDLFPFLRGNIIGWLQQGQAAEGLRRGNFNSYESWNNRDISLVDSGKEPGSGRSWCFTGEWTGSQVPEVLGCIGITNQYRPFNFTAAMPANSDVFSLRPNRERRISNAEIPSVPATLVNAGAVIRENKRYSLHQSAATAAAVVTITIYDLITGESRQSDVSRFFNGTVGGAIGAGQERAVGVAFDSGRVYLSVHPTTVANRRVYEFADDTFETPVNTYSITNSTAMPINRCFAVLESTAYSAANGTVRWFNFNENTANADEVLETCPYNTLPSAGANRMITIKDGKFYTFAANNTAGQRSAVVDISSMNQIATLAPLAGTQADLLGIATEPTLGHRQFMHIARGTFGTGAFDYVVAQALAAYTDIPPRSPGDAMKISYRLDVMF